MNKGQGQGNNRKGRQGGRGRRDRRQKDEFDQKIIDIARVTRVMAGGKRMSFRACVVVGDKKGRVGMGIRKGADVSQAINKAATAARKNIITVNMVNGTIPHKNEVRFSGAQVMIKPAPDGTGIISGGPIRPVLELVGLHNVVSKMKGSKNKINNVTATLKALDELRTWDEVKAARS